MIVGVVVGVASGAVSEALLLAKNVLQSYTSSHGAERTFYSFKTSFLQFYTSCQGADRLRERTFSFKLISFNSSSHFAMGLR